MKKRLAIVGGGAAGFFAAINLLELCPELEICIYEAGRRILTKVEISGGGRCNVTHDCCELSKLSMAYPRGRQELLGPFSKFSPSDTVSWFENKGVKLKIESDGRIFPVTDDSKTIVDCLSGCLKNHNVSLRLNCGVKNAQFINGRFALSLTDGSHESSDFLLIASGSSKSGHGLAASFGHTITELAPSLFTFKSRDLRIHNLAGVSFENVGLDLLTDNQKKFRQSGPLLITHWGLSGPAVLKLSAFAARELAESDYSATLTVNWTAERSIQIVKEKLITLRNKLPAKEIAANPQFSLTRRFWENLLEYCHIQGSQHFFEISNQQIDRLAEVLFRSEIRIEGKGEFKEEFVTCGGVSLKEVCFKNFESKKVANLFFAGEVLDIDGITGGFNFQAAWTGGWSVAQAISQRFTDQF